MTDRALDLFHPAVDAWFRSAFAAPTAPEVDAWPAITSVRNALLRRQVPAALQFLG